MNPRSSGVPRIAGALSVALLCAAPSLAQELKVEERTLSNGMRLLLVPRHDEPTIAGGWVAHVGSANERPGITGISHLFEHMMFKGTPTIGLKSQEDPEKARQLREKDAQLIAEQERVRGLMREEESKLRAALRRGEIDDWTKPENKSPRYKELEKEFDSLVLAQREILAKNAFSQIYTERGGSGMNAFTNKDITGYFITIPKNKLELWMWMESDRLGTPVFREFYSERDVVFEERRRSLESTPTGRLDEAFDEMFWHGHPYMWRTIGYPSDLPAITKEQADAYYGLYYAPNNITAILVGDFDPKEAAELADRYFGRIPRGKVAPPEVTTIPPKWEGEMRFSGEAETNPQVEIRWHTVGFQHKDSYPLQVLAQLLNGRTGRLYKALVMPENAVATDTGSGQSSQKYAGSFVAFGEVKEGKTPDDLEHGLDREIDRLKTEIVPPDELQKVKNNFAAAAYRRLSSNMPILNQLIVSDGLGDWRELNEGPKKVQAVTAEDVKRVAQTYLVKTNRGVATYTRKGGGAAAPEDPELAKLPEQSRPMVKRRLADIAATTDTAKLKESIARMEAQAGQAPPQMKDALELVLKRSKERLAELEKTEKK